MADKRDTFDRTLYMFLGLILGLFLGYQVVPGLMPDEAPTAAELEARQVWREREEARVAGLLEGLGTVESARVFIEPGSGTPARRFASVVVTGSGGAALSEADVAGISELAAGALDASSHGFVAVYDTDGRLLNREPQVAMERKLFWTGLAKNGAKVLGILAALITLRYVAESARRFLRHDDGAPTR